MVGGIGGRRAAAAAAAVAVIAGIVPFVGRAGAASAAVEIRGSAFLPSEVHVNVGDSVTWTNFDADRHTVQGGPMASPEFTQGGSFSFTFGEAGVFNYICRLHTFMTGSVVVDGAGGAAPAAAAPAPAAPDPLLAPSPAPAAPAPAAAGPAAAAPAAVTPASGPAGPAPVATSGAVPLVLALGLDADPLPRVVVVPTTVPTVARPVAAATSQVTTPPPTAPPTTVAAAPTAPMASSLESAGKPLGDGTTLAPFHLAGDVKVFDLDMVEVMQEVEPGVVKPAYAFNGVIPGPVLRVNEGDKVRMIVKNDLPFDTGVHWHGMVLPNDQDGVPGITQPPIMPGETYTYEFTAIATGTHWYHTHSSGRHIGKGLYGVFEVVPKKGDFEADHDYRVMIGDTDLGFTFNGKSYPATTTLKAEVGQKIRIRVVDTGDQVHAIHLHGTPFEVVAQDGIPIKAPDRMDTVTISPGQTLDLIATFTNPGKWLLHCHIFGHSHKTDDTHSMNGAAAAGADMTGMTGMVTIVNVSPSGHGESALGIGGSPGSAASTWWVVVGIIAGLVLVAGAVGFFLVFKL